MSTKPNLHSDFRARAALRSDSNPFLVPVYQDRDELSRGMLVAMLIILAVGIAMIAFTRDDAEMGKANPAPVPAHRVSVHRLA